jgi:hypothetical protein
VANLTVLSLDDPVDASLASINGNFSALNNELAGKATASHGHDASAIVSGVLAAARLGSGSPTQSTFLRGDGSWQQVQWQDVSGRPTSFPPEVHTHDGSEIATGTVPLVRLGGGTPSPSTFLRGDQTWQAVSWGDITGKPAEAWQLVSGGIAYVGGLVGIGTSLPTEILHLYSGQSATRILVEAERDQNFTSGELVCKAWSGGGLCSGGIIRGYSARGSRSSPQGTQAPDRLIQITGYGHDGAVAAIGAQIRYIAGSAWSSSNRHTDIYIEANGPNENNIPTRFRLEGIGAFVLTVAPGTPATPAASAEAKIYVKGSKLVVQYNDAGTVRYKYLDLAGTGVSWVHTTTAP